MPNKHHLEFLAQAFLKVISVFLLGGCAQMMGWSVNNFQYESIEASDASKIPPETFYSKRAGGSSSQKVLKIDFSTTSNLWALVTEESPSLNLWYTVRTCNHGPLSVNLSDWGYIYWYGIAVNSSPVPEQTAQYESMKTEHKFDAKFEYSVYINYQAKERDIGAYYQYGYNLKENPTDLCMMLGGGMMMFPIKMETEEIVIPKQDLIEALSRL